MHPSHRPSRRIEVLGVFAALVLLSQPTLSLAELPPLISRDILFGNPEKVSPKLSPDGTKLAWIAPDSKDVLQVWVKPVGEDGGKIVTDDKKRGIRQFFWAQNSKVLLYVQDKDGDEDFHVYGVSLDTGSIRDFTPDQKVRAQITAVDPKFPDEILIALNKRNPQLHDVYKLDINTGERDLIVENPGDVVSYSADPNLVVRAAQAMTPDGGTVIRIRDDATSEWREWIKAGPEDALTLAFLDFTADGTGAYLISALGRDKAALVKKDIATGKEEVVAESDEVDVDGAFLHPTEHRVRAVSFSPGRTNWKVLDPEITDDFAEIRKLHEGDFGIANTDTKDRHWLVAFDSDHGPVSYYAWDRDAKKGTFMFTHQPKLEGLALAKMEPIKLTARDGMTLHGFLTLPVGVEPKNLPMVLYVHGGPWARDGWGYDAAAQWFANRGYACLQINFRGSTGYGKKFLNAANKQWGKTMHADLIDASKWAIDQGYADPKKIAIFGGSYGGYSALAGVTFTPEFFACSVDIVGPSNLRTLVESIPPYWKPMRSVFDNRMGNIDDPKDAELLKEASPLFKADKIVRPLLIGQGANDPRVKQAESEQIVEAIEKNGGSVTYVLYPDEGHGFARPPNRIDFFARAEKFLADHLGGRFEPLPAGGKIEDSTAVVREVGKK